MAKGRKKQQQEMAKPIEKQQQAVEVPASNSQVSLEDKIISAVLNSKDGYGIISKVVNEHSFADFQNKLIWKACRTLSDMRINIEISTICTCLQAHYNTSMLESTLEEKASVKTTVDEVISLLKK